MNEEDVFFDSPSEQSIIKIKIVFEYYKTWTSIIKCKWDKSIPMGYVDLFSGPGKYSDGTDSVPLRVIKYTLADQNLRDRMYFFFNDGNEDNLYNLKNNIEECVGSDAFMEQIEFSNHIIDINTSSRFLISNKNMPVLSFVDPFGYKGITSDLIEKLIQNNGSDCIFFFNYNRINMALSNNTFFDEHLAGLFGEKGMAQLKGMLADKKPAEREPIILEALIESLCTNRKNYIIPFKFYCKEMRRTSHFIVFVTKHPMGCKVMKNIMYSNSAKDSDGVASFEFKDKVLFCFTTIVFVPELLIFIFYKKIE